MDYQIIIHAGGEGTRLRPYTLDRPKALLDVNGKSLLEMALQPFINTGITKFIMTASYKVDMITSFLKEKGINMRVIDEPKPAGKSGSIRLGIEQGIIDPEKPGVILHVDDVINFDFNKVRKIHEASGCLITLGLSNAFRNPFGVVNVSDNKVSTFVEKPMETLGEGRGINTGLAMFKNFNMFKDVPIPSHTEDIVYPSLAERGQIGCFFVTRWRPINTKLEYHKLLEEEK